MSAFGYLCNDIEGPQPGSLADRPLLGGVPEGEPYALFGGAVLMQPRDRVRRFMFWRALWGGFAPATRMHLFGLRGRRLNRSGR